MHAAYGAPPYGAHASLLSHEAVLFESADERPFGAFLLSVRVPDQYQKRWSEAKLADGVLRMSYAADDDEDAAAVF